MRDIIRGLRLTADAVLTEAPQLDLLHVPGGYGQEAAMDDAEILSWIAVERAARDAFSRTAPGREFPARRDC